MKHAFSALLLGGIFFAAIPATQAQIRDDESSMNYLAIQCAVSGGRNVGDYAEYCRRLAKTVAHLDSGAQERVFGFVPQPVAQSNAHPDYNPDLHGSFGGSPYANTSGEAEDTTPIAGGDPFHSSNEREPDSPLVDAVGKFNDTLNGSETEGGAIIGGSPPEQEEESTKPDSNNRGRNSDWWEGFLGWLSVLSQKLADSAEK